MTIAWGSKGGFLYAVDIFAPPTDAANFTRQTPTFFLTSGTKTITSRYSATKTGVYYLVFDDYCYKTGPFQFKVSLSGPTPPSSGSVPAAPIPVADRSVAVALVSGQVGVKRPGTRTFVPLTVGVLIPVGSVVNTTNGRVRLTSARAGTTYSGEFYGGEFTVTQTTGRLTDLILTGGVPCATTAARASRTPVPKQHLWGSAHGGFETSGAYASATELGTTWLARDKCAGTLIRVASGRVRVQNFVTHRVLVLRAPHTYFAHA